MRNLLLLFVGLGCLSCWLQAQPPALRKISIDEAIQLGLKNNLSALQAETSNSLARVRRIRALSALLPTVNGSAGEYVQEINLATFGFRFPGFPTIIGPFGYSDLRASASMNLLDWSARKSLQAAEQNQKAVALSGQDARDLVVEAVANSYLSIIAAGARVEAARSEAATAQALYERARDQHTAGVSPAIDELRSQVEWKARQQQLLAAQNLFAKDKLTLARVTGLPPAQDFDLSDAAPYAPLEGLTPEEMLDRAHQSRGDYLSLKAQIRAAETTRDAALAERYPKLALEGNYGANGVNVGQLHPTFAFVGSVKVNIFDGGRIHADAAQAEIEIRQRKDELGSLDQHIDVDIRSALLDLKSAADQVAVARDNLDLANQTLTQARDRFVAGVTDNIEVVQAQDAVAGAQEALISSMYAHNLAKAALSRAVGMTDANLKQFMGTSK
ncbi:MAG: TolC family protein [Acidobacteriota bacterium]